MTASIFLSASCSRRRLSAYAHLIDMTQEIGRIFIDTDRARLAQLVGAVTAAEQANAERSAARRSKHILNAVTNDERILLAAG